jgi:hypothetical protein
VRQAPPPPVHQPPPPAPARQRSGRPWYTEPTVLGTIGVLIVVAILFVVLLNAAFRG